MYDIVGSLPLEVLIQVVECLDLEDIVRSQRVSKTWYRIFTCDTIIAPFLRETLAFLGLDLEGVSIDMAIPDAASYFRWRHGLQHVQPVRKIFLPWPTDYVSSSIGRIQCYSHRLCYDNPKRGDVQMLDLETGKKSTWARNNGLAGSGQITLSDRYLVTERYEKFWSEISGTSAWATELTAWDLHMKRKRVKRLKVFYSHYTIVGDTVVVAPLPSKVVTCPVYVWDLSSNHVQKIGSFGDLRLYHLAAAENILVTFEINWEKPSPEVQQTKWTTTTGQPLERKVFHLPLPADDPIKRFEHALDTCHTYGHKTVTQSYHATGKYARIHLEYDYADDRLRVRLLHCDKYILDEVSQDYSAYLTRNLVYRCTFETGEVAVYNSITGKVTLHPIKLPGSHALMADTSSNSTFKESEDVDTPFSEEYLQVFGDREVFGMANLTGIQLWFFNPKFAPDPRDWR